MSSNIQQLNRNVREIHIRDAVPDHRLKSLGDTWNLIEKQTGKIHVEDVFAALSGHGSEKVFVLCPYYAFDDVVFDILGVAESSREFLKLETRANAEWFSALKRFSGKTGYHTLNAMKLSGLMRVSHAGRDAGVFVESSTSGDGKCRRWFTAQEIQRWDEGIVIVCR